jgi:hypothetical protein
MKWSSYEKVHGSVPLCDANLFTIGTTSRAQRWKSGGGTYYSAKIGATKKNGTYNIDFDDSEKKRKWCNFSVAKKRKKHQLNFYKINKLTP